MTEYWKSLGRKFCDFCKCWITDNRPSIEFHENGKKHQENVNKRLKEIHKNSSKQAKDQKKFEDEFKKMEKAAMAAYLKDVENNMIDMTAENLIKEKGTLDTRPPEDIDPCDPTPHRSSYSQPKQSSSGKNNKQGKGKGKGKPDGKGKGKQGHEIAVKLGSKKVWYEAKSPEGYTYYWNTETNESVWEVPAEGFMSIQEQENESKERAIQEQFLEQIKKEEEEQKAEVSEEQRANVEREKMKEIRKKIKKEKVEEPEEQAPYLKDYSVQEKPQPYGAWKPVVEVKSEPVDLQLPAKKQIIIAPIIQKEVQVKQFKEKQISQISTWDSDDECGPSTFKKRKFGNRSARQKMTDI